MGTLGAGTTTRTGTIAADSECVSVTRRVPIGPRTYYARRHTFTLDAAATVTIDLRGDPNRRPPLDLYLIVLDGHSADGAGTVLARNDNIGGGHGTNYRNSQIADLALQPGDYTIEATTNPQRRTGDYTLTVAVAPTACSDNLGTLTANRYARAGTLGTDTACTAEHRGSQASPHRARRHTFTLDAPAWVDIDLAKTSASSLDPYVLLIDTNNEEPEIIEQDDNSGTGNAAQIQGRYLEPGTYTIEATTATATGNAANGDYTLTVIVPISGLAATNSVTVDEQTTLTFNYWPNNADIVAVSEDLVLATVANDGGFTMLLAPDRAQNHAVSVHMGASTALRSGPAGAARGTTARNAQRSNTARSFRSTVNGECRSGTELSPINGVLCVSPSSDPDPRLAHVDEEPSYNRATGTYAYYDGPYEVTVGALLGARDAAQQAIDARRGQSCSPGRSMGVHELTALMLAIGVWENPNSRYMTINNKRELANMRFPARSLMTLSRKDHEWTRLGDVRVANGEDNSRLYSFNDASAVPHRAFWHPGVGMWQLDTLSNSVALNHGQRADTRFGGVTVAKELLRQSCRLKAGQLEGSFEYWLEGKWLACQPGEPPDNYQERITKTSQCLLTKGRIWMNNGSRDDLFVTVRDNSRHVSLTGGADLLDCHWQSTKGVDEIDGGGHEQLSGKCYFYDSEHPEGMVVSAQDEGHREQQFNTKGEDVSLSPYAAPFVSFTDGGTRFAVFPASLLDGYATTLIKSVPVNKPVRLHSATSWHRSYFDGRDLRLRLCQVGALFAPAQCAWVSVNADASAPGGSFASWIAAARG